MAFPKDRKYSKATANRFDLRICMWSAAQRGKDSRHRETTRQGQRGGREAPRAERREAGAARAWRVTAARCHGALRKDDGTAQDHCLAPHPDRRERPRYARSAR